MDNDKQKGPLYTISGLAIILTALGITIFTQSPFKGSRPSESDLREPVKVNARLWQDPFLAVMDHVKAFGQLSRKGPYMSALFAWSCAFMLRCSAEDGRAGVVHRLKEQLASCYFDEKPDCERIK